ncbi:hypothetical protein T440DRAFT_23228 [Plenodomus tracheiphilus IPT5]|uniref:CSN8/PSMD8/EIF3K domain-containing protein n=1 Tax=Plenodomus tracheiphilus IPT5 TaxID=1408161 RepID=A0A6A7BC28_9PLEO|nr:hypothetical protein T440DRAFT_23228 [Plenodomus tracheiphilus IPT5]
MKSTDPIRPSSRRGASGAWNRLKPVREDPLETYGLPSKGETRLNDFKTQETYFNRIIERYMKLCALNREELNTLFASISSTHSASVPISNTTSLNASFSSLSLSKHAPKPTPTAPTIATIPPNALTPSINELATVLASLRKLREAITASDRCDAFALRAYFFAIHVSILCSDWSSYLPALHALLSKLHPRNPLPPHDLREYVGLLILDQCCRQADYAGARATRLFYGYKDWRVEGVMSALVQDNWYQFWRLRRGVDGYQRAIMGWAEKGMRVHVLKCVGRSYLSVERAWLEGVTDKGWEELVGDGVGWELVGDRVVVRKPKGS